MKISIISSKEEAELLDIPCDEFIAYLKKYLLDKYQGRMISEHLRLTIVNEGNRIINTKITFDPSAAIFLKEWQNNFGAKFSDDHCIYFYRIAPWEIAHIDAHGETQIVKGEIHHDV